MTFKQWFDDMEIRYQASYGSYEELLQEAFEAGAKQEREACAKVCEEVGEHPSLTPLHCAESIRARSISRGEA